ncbi:GEVED domain-containing protein [uncultured Sulfitobacter sp.]|uniref:GEVED domain-containing protein n=1 Tax=uncultured Sulfitobacter sp. TaxID=191468 RepID=UPI0030D715DB
MSYKMTSRLGYFLLRLICVGVFFVGAMGEARSSEDCGAACVFAGPRMASVETSESELLGPLLSGLLGTDVDVSVLDWNAIAGANVGLLDVLGTGDLSVSNPGQLVDVDVTLLELVEASIDAAEADNNTAAVSALNALRLPIGELQGTIRLADLITLGLPEGALADIELSALDLIGGAIQLYNYENIATTTQPIALDSPLLQQLGIGGAELLLQVVEPPHFECGGAGAKFHTSTVRAKLSLNLANMALDTAVLDSLLGPLVGGLIRTDITLGNFDIYFEFGRVDGKVVSADPETKTASVILLPSAVDLFLGSIDDAIFFNRERAILQSDVDYGQVGQIKVSTLGGLVSETLGIGVKSFAQSAPGTSKTLFFSPPYPQRQSFGDGASSFSELIGTLARNLDIQIEDSLSLPLAPLVDTVIEPVVGDLVGGLLVDAVSPVLDLTVDPLLGFFGVGIGEAEASISGVTSICVERSDCPISGLAPDGTNNAAYGSPTHLIYDTLFMGFSPPDEDTAPRANADATGDDETGSDDEDGVEVSTLKTGSVTEIGITLHESGGQSGFLQGWIDWNGDGRFTEDERIAKDLTLPGGGVLNLSVTVPDSARPGNSFARFRWSTQTGLDPVSAAADGEVEDIQVAIKTGDVSQLRGQVIEDNGSGDGVALDAQLNGEETGIGGVTVLLETPDSQILSSVQTDDLGNWAVSLPDSYEGPLIARIIPQGGMLAVSQSAPTASPGTPSENGSISFSTDDVQSMSDITFGLIEEPRLYHDGQAFVEAGQVAVLFHDYVAGATSEVTLFVEGVPDDIATVSLFRDPDCNGTLTTPILGLIATTADERLCFGARMSTSSGLPPGQRVTFDVVALTRFSGGAEHVARNTDVVLIASQDGGIVLEKTVENLTKGTEETRANFAAPGDVIMYRLKLTHTGLSPVEDVEVSDVTPPHTALDRVMSQTVSMADGSECTLVFPENPAVGYRGSLRWFCEGGVSPGTQVELTFSVRISP